MTDIIVKIMVEVLSISRSRQRILNRGERASRCFRFVALELCLTQEEARMATAEVMKVSHSVEDKVKVVLDGA